MFLRALFGFIYSSNSQAVQACPQSCRAQNGFYVCFCFTGFHSPVCEPSFFSCSIFFGMMCMYLLKKKRLRLLWIQILHRAAVFELQQFFPQNQHMDSDTPRPKSRGGAGLIISEQTPVSVKTVIQLHDVESCRDLMIWRLHCGFLSPISLIDHCSY